MLLGRPTLSGAHMSFDDACTLDATRVKTRSTIWLGTNEGEETIIMGWMSSKEDMSSKLKLPYSQKRYNLIAVAIKIILLPPSFEFVHPIG